MSRIGQDFRIFKGEKKSLIVTVRDEDGALVDLSGKAAMYRVTPSPSALSPQHIEMTDADMTILSLGVYKIPFVAADTLSLPAKQYYHELRIGDMTADIVVLTGSFHVLPSVTN